MEDDGDSLLDRTYDKIKNSNNSNNTERETEMETESHSQPQLIQVNEGVTNQGNETNAPEPLKYCNSSNVPDQCGGGGTVGIVRSESSKSLNDSSSTEDFARHELRKLSLDQNGTFMVDFDPEKSQREMRKMNRRIYIKESKRNLLYDDKGLLLESPIDLCDCLDKICPGCHFPCPKCGSGKCGVDCRCNRKYVVDFIEVEGMEATYNFPT